MYFYHIYEVLFMKVRDDFLLYNNKDINQNVLLSAKSKRRMRKSKSDNTLKSYGVRPTSSLPCPASQRILSTTSMIWQTMPRPIRFLAG